MAEVLFAFEGGDRRVHVMEAWRETAPRAVADLTAAAHLISTQARVLSRLRIEWEA